MNIQEFLVEMVNIQNSLLHFIEEEYEEMNFQNLINLIEQQKTIQDRQKFHSFLYLLSKVSNNHQRNADLISKFEKILNFYSNDIKQAFSNTEIYHIFKSNKRILLFLIKKEMVSIDHHICISMSEGQFKKANYYDYFQPEIQLKPETEKFEEQRLRGKNNDMICFLIQNDSLKEFVSFVNQINIPLNSTIKTSIFETNSILNKKEEHTLIEYAVFYGSLRIFLFLKMNFVDLTPSLWLYAIHSRNYEIIRILEENAIEPENNDYLKCYAEAIKCHHNDIANYIIENKLNESQNISIFSLQQAIKNYNFSFIPKDSMFDSVFYELCKYDQAYLVKNLLTSYNINSCNTITISINSFLYNFKFDFNDIFNKTFCMKFHLNKLLKIISKVH